MIHSTEPSPTILRTRRILSFDSSLCIKKADTRMGICFLCANVLIGLFENLSHTNGFLDFRATNFLVFHFTI